MSPSSPSVSAPSAEGLPDGVVAVNVQTLPTRFVVRGQLLHSFTRPTGVDRQTGNEYGGDINIQLLSVDVLRNGERRIEQTTVSVSPEHAERLRAKVGQVIDVPVLVRSTARGLQVYGTEK